MSSPASCRRTDGRTKNVCPAVAIASYAKDHVTSHKTAPEPHAGVWDSRHRYAKAQNRMSAADPGRGCHWRVNSGVMIGTSARTRGRGNI